MKILNLGVKVGRSLRATSVICRDRRAEQASDEENADGSQKLSWWSRRKINREQDAALLMAKKRASDRTDDGQIVTNRPEQSSATPAPASDKSQSELPAGHESMFDALAKARRAAKDRTKE